MLIRQNLVHEAVLNVYPARKRASEVAYKRFVWRRILKRIDGDYVKQSLDIGAQS